MKSKRFLILAIGFLYSLLLQSCESRDSEKAKETKPTPPVNTDTTDAKKGSLDSLYQRVKKMGKEDSLDLIEKKAGIKKSNKRKVNDIKVVYGGPSMQKSGK